MIGKKIVCMRKIAEINCLPERCIRKKLSAETAPVISGITCICHDTGMCHYFGYFLGCSQIFGVPFWAIPGFLGILFGKI